MNHARLFDRTRYLVVRGTGRRAASVPFGCNWCDHEGKCRCLQDAWAFARLVGGEVMAVESLGRVA